MKPSLASACTNSLIASATVAGRADERLPPGHLDDQLADGQVASPRRAPATAVAVASGSRYMRTLARPRAMVCSPDDAGRCRAAGRRGRSADRSRFHSCSRNLIAVCPLTCWRRTSCGLLLRLGVGVAEHERRRGQDQQLVAAAAVPGEPALDVGVERLARLERAVPAEDRVGAGGGELAALVGVAGLEDHRTALRAARHVELAARCRTASAWCRTRPACASAGRSPDSWSATISSPRQESNSSQAAARNSLGPRVALVLGQEAAAAEVLAGERVPGGDDVPRRPGRRRGGRGVANWRATS